MIMRRDYKGISINTSKNTHETVFELLDKTKDRVIGDIPCGSGAFVLRLKDHGFTRVKAIDIENILEIDHNDFVQADMTKTWSMENESLDALVCIDGIEHISQQFEFVREANRVLKNQGEFIVSTPNISSLKSRWKWFTTGHHHKCSSPLDENHPTPLHHIGMISYPEIRYQLHTSGFSIVEVTTNRIKPVNLLYGILVPFFYLMSLSVYWRVGRKEGTWNQNKEILRTMFSSKILFGETMIVKAIKKRSIS